MKTAKIFPLQPKEMKQVRMILKRWHVMAGAIAGAMASAWLAHGLRHVAQGISF
jgi:hypothetical protein